MANEGFTTAPDFADYLVKEKELTFRESYAVAAKHIKGLVFLNVFTKFK